MLDFTLQNMLRLVVFIFSIGIQGLVKSHQQVESFDPQQNLVLPNENPTKNPRTCPSKEVQRFFDAFHNCFIHKKYEDGGEDLDSLVDRILEHSRLCIENSTVECRPNLKGFIAMMDKVIHQMRDYSYIYLEHMTRERVNIKDLKCIEESLSKEIYKSCFKEVLGEGLDSSEKKFKQKVENATSCMNKSLKLCSMAAKTSLNRMFRILLRVEQPRKERIEDQLKPEPPKKRYNYITPFGVEQQKKEDTKKKDNKEELKTEPPKKRYNYSSSPKVEQPEKEDIEDELQPESSKTRYDYIPPFKIEREDIVDEVNEPQRDPQPEPQKKWYHHITEPFIMLWNAVKSFFTC